MIEKVNNEFKKRRTFTQFKIKKIGQINQIIDKNTKIFSKLFKDLDNFGSNSETSIIDNLNKKTKKVKNKTDSIINVKQKTTNNKTKLKIRQNEQIQFNLSFNIKKSPSLNVYSNNSTNTNKFYFIKSPLHMNQIYYNKLNTINNSSNFKEKHLFQKKLNLFKKPNYEIDNKNNSCYNYKSDGNENKTFITQQKSDSIIKNYSTIDKIKLNNFTNLKSKTQQYFFRNLSKQLLNDYIDNSNNIFNEQYNKFMEDEENVSMTINNIKNMIKEGEEKKIYNVNKDIDIPKIRKNMKLFKSSLKGKISYQTKDLFKTSMITKKIADLINCWETFSRINDEYFYNNKKAFFKIYPPLSEKATKDPFNKDYERIYYHMAQKNKMKKSQSYKNRLSI